MRTFLRTRRKPDDRPVAYGEGRAEHRAMRVGHIVRPQYSRKVVRMITRRFR